jgi:shikimate kinase
VDLAAVLESMVPLIHGTIMAEYFALAFDSTGLRMSCGVEGIPIPSPWPTMINMSAVSNSKPRLPKTVVLIGLMGAGKTSVGRRLAELLGVEFVDADTEIEEAAGCTIADFFERFGEEEFRRGEERVIVRLLKNPPCVLATGGGAYMSSDTRAEISDHGLSLWLKADLNVLYERVARRSGRPLLQTDDPRSTLEGIMKVRYPVYAEADLTVQSYRGPIEKTVERAYQTIIDYIATTDGAAQ